MEALDGHLRGPGVPPPPASNDEKSEGEGEGSSVGTTEEETIAGVVMVGGKGAGRRALIEYVMLAGVNDTAECGRELGELLKVWWWFGLRHFFVFFARRFVTFEYSTGTGPASYCTVYTWYVAIARVYGTRVNAY